MGLICMEQLNNKGCGEGAGPGHPWEPLWGPPATFPHIPGHSESWFCFSSQLHSFNHPDTLEMCSVGSPRAQLGTETSKGIWGGRGWWKMAAEGTAQGGWAAVLDGTQGGERPDPMVWVKTLMYKRNRSRVLETKGSHVPPSLITLPHHICPFPGWPGALGPDNLLFSETPQAPLQMSKHPQSARCRVPG